MSEVRWAELPMREEANALSRRDFLIGLLAGLNLGNGGEIFRDSSF